MTNRKLIRTKDTAFDAFVVRSVEYYDYYGDHQIAVDIGNGEGNQIFQKYETEDEARADMDRIIEEVNDVLDPHVERYDFHRDEARAEMDRILDPHKDGNQ